MDIERMAKALRLGNLRRGFRAIIDEAVRGSMSYQDFLGLVLERELESREDSQEDEGGPVPVPQDLRGAGLVGLLGEGVRGY